MFCPHCGVLNPADSSFCVSCGAQLKPPAQPDSGTPAPAAPLPSPTLPAAPNALPAGLGDRLLAVIIDTVLLASVFAAVGMWAAIRWGGITEAGFSVNGTPAAVAISATLLFGFLYYWVFEGAFGATLGKGMLGLSVRRKDGAPCGFSQSLVRNLVRLIDGIGVYFVGFLVAILSSSRQRLGDHLAHTVVVTKPAGKLTRAMLVVAWLVTCAGGFAGAWMLHRAAPGATGGDLRVASAAFVQSKDGPPRAAGPYQPGDTVHLKYQVMGFTRGNQGKIDLVLQAVVRDPNGLAMYEPWEKELVQTVEAGEPVNGSFSASLPAFAPPGAYRIELKVHDKVKTVSVEAAPAFQVDAPAVAPATRLEIRDFAIALAKDGPPVETPILQGGGAVYMRWKIFGVEARDAKVDLRVALKVIGPGGKVVLDEPKYIVVDEAFSYRPPSFCLPMSGHLTLPGSFPTGTYAAQFTVTDDVAKAEIQQTANFDLR